MEQASSCEVLTCVSCKCSKEGLPSRLLGFIPNPTYVGDLTTFVHYASDWENYFSTHGTHYEMLKGVRYLLSLPEEELRCQPTKSPCSVLHFACECSPSDIERRAEFRFPPQTSNFQARYLAASLQLGMVCISREAALKKQREEDWQGAWRHWEHVNDRLYALQYQVRPWQTPLAAFRLKRGFAAVSDGHKPEAIEQVLGFVADHIKKLETNRRICASELNLPNPSSNRQADPADLAPWHLLTEPTKLAYGNYWFHYIQHASNETALRNIDSFLLKWMKDNNAEDSPLFFPPPRKCTDCDPFTDAEYLNMITTNQTADNVHALYKSMGYVGDIVTDNRSDYTFLTLRLFIVIRHFALYESEIASLKASGQVEEDVLDKANAAVVFASAIKDEFKDIFDDLARWDQLKGDYIPRYWSRNIEAVKEFNYRFRHTLAEFKQEVRHLRVTIGMRGLAFPAPPGSSSSASSSSAKSNPVETQKGVSKSSSDAAAADKKSSIGDDSGDAVPAKVTAAPPSKTTKTTEASKPSQTVKTAAVAKSAETAKPTNPTKTALTAKPTNATATSKTSKTAQPSKTSKAGSTTTPAKAAAGKALNTSEGRAAHIMNKFNNIFATLYPSDEESDDDSDIMEEICNALTAAKPKSSPPFTSFVKRSAYSSSFLPAANATAVPQAVPTGAATSASAPTLSGMSATNTTTIVGNASVSKPTLPAPAPAVATATPLTPDSPATAKATPGAAATDNTAAKSPVLTTTTPASTPGMDKTPSTAVTFSFPAAALDTLLAPTTPSVPFVFGSTASTTSATVASAAPSTVTANLPAVQPTPPPAPDADFASDAPVDMAAPSTPVRVNTSSPATAQPATPTTSTASDANKFITAPFSPASTAASLSPEESKKAKVSIEASYVLDRYKCSICTLPMACAISLHPCGDSFCYSCIAKHLFTEGLECPCCGCEDAISLSSSLPNRMVDNMVRDILTEMGEDGQEQLASWRARAERGAKIMKNTRAAMQPHASSSNAVAK